jgi:16S rRNA processing protein RimM
MNSPDHLSKNPQARQPPEYLDVGLIVRPHGIRGELVLQPFSELIQILKPSIQIHLGAERTAAIIRGIRPHHSRYLLSIEGCEDRDTAEKLRGEVVCIRFAEAKPLSDGVYYHWQILDMQVFTTEGDFLGTIVEILETGANDVYVIRDEQGDEILLPAIEDVVVEVDLETSKLIVNIPPGLLPEK